jgi:hypothetical protein
MKSMRWTALGVGVTVCLLTAAPALAGDGPARRAPGLALGGPGGWVLEWIVRIATSAYGFGGERAGEGERAGLRPVFAENGCSIDPKGQPLCSSGEEPVTASGDNGSCIDPHGTPVCH